MTCLFEYYQTSYSRFLNIYFESKKQKNTCRKGVFFVALSCFNPLNGTILYEVTNNCNLCIFYLIL